MICCSLNVLPIILHNISPTYFKCYRWFQRDSIQQDATHSLFILLYSWKTRVIECTIQGNRSLSISTFPSIKLCVIFAAEWYKNPYHTKFIAYTFAKIVWTLFMYKTECRYQIIIIQCNNWRDIKQRYQSALRELFFHPLARHSFFNENIAICISR